MWNVDRLIECEIRRSRSEHPLREIECLGDRMSAVCVECEPEWDRVAQYFGTITHVFDDWIRFKDGRSSPLRVVNMRGSVKYSAYFILEPFPHWEVWSRDSNIAVRHEIGEMQLVWDYESHEDQSGEVCPHCNLRGQSD